MTDIKPAAPRQRGLLGTALRDPLTHFVIGGALLFAAWAGFSPQAAPPPDPMRIEITEDDLLLIVEDFVEKQKVLEASEYPEEFDKAQIKSRQKVLKTYILKLKAALEYRSDVYEPMSEMITAYNALRTQFNVTVNNTLNTKLLLDK
jgi:hypothetical protein